MERPEELESIIYQEGIAAQLKEAGFTTLGALAKVSAKKLTEKAKVPASVAEKIVKAAKAEQEREATVEEARILEEFKEPEERVEEPVEPEVTLPSGLVDALLEHADIQADIAEELAGSLAELPEFREDLLSRAMKSKTFRARLIRRLIKQWS